MVEGEEEAEAEAEAEEEVEVVGEAEEVLSIELDQIKSNGI